MRPPFLSRWFSCFVLLCLVVVSRPVDAGRFLQQPEADPADVFLSAIIKAMTCANGNCKSSDGKRVIGRDNKTGRKFVIKQWKEQNDLLKEVRYANIPKGYGGHLIENVFGRKIRQKFNTIQPKSTSRSGSIIFFSDFDHRTKSNYLLKSEKKADVIRGVLPILKKYGQRVAEKDPCDESTLMKVLLIFEPLSEGGMGIDKKVDDKVWMLIKSINPFPPRMGNVVKEYDLKHSREVDRCKSASEDEGALGDFLVDFLAPLRNAVTSWHRSENHFSKCLLSSIRKDLAVVDSEYPKTKLIDQSVLMFAVKPEDNNPTNEELKLAKRNNVIKVSKNGQIWFLVYGIIDLFAEKGYSKWFQSHGTSADYIFEGQKFSLYPFYTFCMSQFLFYYNEFDTNTSFESSIGKSWKICYGKGGNHDKRYVPPLPKKTAILHDAVRYEDRMCSLLQTCDAVLHRKEITENLGTCCTNANDGNPCKL